MPKEAKLGFVGLGLMGLPMARRLLAAGYQLTVWNRSPGKAHIAYEAGAEVAETPCAVAKQSEIVFTCVTDTAAMDSVVFGLGGIAEAEGQGKLLVDHSSIHPEATRTFAERLLKRNGMSWLDAPVSGGVAGAEAGTLAIMAGGSAEDFRRAEPFLADLSRRLSHIGALGAGQTAKLCNQAIVGCTFAVIAEALRLAGNTGIDARALIEAMTDGFADSKPLQIFGPRMLETIDDPIARIEVVLKDMDAALDVARQSKTPMPMTVTAGELYRTLVSRGLGSAEFDALYQSLGAEEEAWRG